MDGIHVEYSNLCVLFTEVFVWQHSDIFIVWISFAFIIRAVGEGISSIGCSWLILQEDIVLGKFWQISCDAGANLLWFSVIFEVCVIGVHQDRNFCAF